MLNSLHIKNLALIEEQEILFEDGLNILTGETGAGKSVIIGSINLALGEQARASVIREGAESCLISLSFSGLPEETYAAIRAMDLSVEPDGSVILERRISPSRSVAKVCGETVSLKQMRELASLLIQIHGQNDHRTLLQEKEQALILDTFAAEELREPLKETALAYDAYTEACARLKASEMDEAARKRAEDLAAFELKEITDAALKEGEDVLLEERYQKMAHAEKIVEALNDTQRFLSSGTDADSASDLIGRSLKELRLVERYDQAVADIASQLTDADAILQDVSRAVGSALADASFEPAAFQEVTERLNLVNRLKDKYGDTIDKVLAYAADREAELARLQDLEAEREEAARKKQETYDALLKCCETLHGIRTERAHILTEEMRKVLSELNFLDNGFEVAVTADETRLSADGYDDVTFFISLNPGEPLKPLHEIASGGELSRIMLAVKTVLADKSALETMIFDEIDAGISGVTAWKVAEKLARLSENRQVICITHLAQIAAMQDVHFIIDKQVTGEDKDVRTLTRIHRIADVESLTELARLLGGSKDQSDAAAQSAYDNAASLRQEAERIKTSLR